MVEKVKTKEIWPIVYRKEYNVRFFGIENFHPFDSKKWGHIYEVRVLCVLTLNKCPFLCIHCINYFLNIYIHYPQNSC